MAFSIGLLLKGLAGLGAASGAVSLGVIYGVDWDPHLLKLPFEERLKQKVPDLVTGDSKLCKEQDSSQSLEKYTCTESGTELKNALKFTTDGNDEWNLDAVNASGQKIEIRQNEDTKNFPFGIMLVWENMGSEVKLKKKDDTNTTKTFQKKTFPEFKLENGKFKYAWTIKTLGEKVGLDCKKVEGTQKICTLKPGKTINVFESSNQKVEDVTFTGTLNWQEDQGCYNQGFKFTPTSNITLSKGGETNLPISSLSTSNSYDIKLADADDGTNKWYLRKYDENNQ